ncbi:MAG: Ig-like domain-containing protein [Treponema sp.]|nr:Ig-like domain-containing protein [Treponema sp.]
MKKCHFWVCLVAIVSWVAFMSCPLDEDPLVPPVDVDGVTLNRENVSLHFHPERLGSQATLVASISPPDATNRTLRWSTSNPEVATVINGLVTAIGVGNAIITVTTSDGGFTDSSNVTVIPPVFYSDFGAVGDGETCDFLAIRAAHTAANADGARVFADPGAVYFIGNANIPGAAANAANPIIIQTDTDWTGAKFILDDNLASNATQWVFRVAPSQPSENILSRFSSGTLAENQTRVNLNPPLGRRVLLFAIDNNVIRYRRSGQDANQGTTQRDIFIIDEDGNVDMSAPIIWGFDNVTTLTAFYIDEEPLTITGGHFETIAILMGQGPGTGARTGYVRRGIEVRRSNTIIDGIHHTVRNNNGIRPYYGFIYVRDAVDVTLQNATLTGKWNNGTTGTYGMVVEYSINFRAINVGQTNDITSNNYWGIFASNYSKNIYFDNVRFSRFDAHQGVRNTTIRNSQLGWQGIQIIGCGLLTIENTTIRANHFIQLRLDFGSKWDGDVIIRNCIFIPAVTWSRIIHTGNPGNHDHGYVAYFPHNITIDGFTILETAITLDGPITLVGGVASAPGAQFPYVIDSTINIYTQRFTTGRNPPWQVSNDPTIANRITVVQR